MNAVASSSSSLIFLLPRNGSVNGVSSCCYCFCLSSFSCSSPSSSSSSSSIALTATSINKSNRYNLFIIMGRSKRSPSPKGSEPTPPRITSNVKQNLQFLKLWKEFQKRKSSTPKPATSYRKKKVEKEDLHEETEFYRDPTTTLYYTNQGLETAVPVLLVDGYNVCGYWAKLKKHFMNGRLDIARQKLIDELLTFSLLRGFSFFPLTVQGFIVFIEEKIECAIDLLGTGQGLHVIKRGRILWKVAVLAGLWALWLERNKGFLREWKNVWNFVERVRFCVDIVFSGESCADAWIEKEVVALREDGCPRVWVATSDHVQQHAAHGAGAFVWSCKALVSEIKASKKEVEMMLQEHRSTSFQGRLLKHNLDSDVVDALKDLRKKLSETKLK
ncbi:yacP-like NYN domain protein [Trema orientale]|uniref:YacP-like NYN domain protein n=1 Tax=Trema orientale TaxID=63057 RepID=A0A2P5E5R6_TREOI|nr:yacP-like NYN domain protein [Trema orientale]